MIMIASYVNGGKLSCVMYDEDTDDYVVRFFSDGEYMDGSDYSTFDRDDAIRYAKNSIEMEKEWVDTNR